MRRANLARFCGDDANLLRPVCVQTGREDGGQCLMIGQEYTRAEAPRQRLKGREPRPALVGQSTWIWLRTGSVYGIPVTPFLTHAWFMCESDGAKGSLYDQKVSVSNRRPERHCNLFWTPSGEQTQPKSGEGIARDLGELVHSNNNLPVNEPEVGGVIVVWEREIRSHGEGHQPAAIEP